MILVTGATGFVGHKLMQLCGNTLAAPSLRGMTAQEIAGMIEESGADTIVHTAAISDIGVCQRDPEASYLANVQIPVWLAEAAKGRKLVCFSSDQVYSGLETEGPYSEDTVCPGNVYAEHKLAMERKVLDLAPDAVMLRAEWMYDHYLKRANYLMTILNATESVCFSSRQYRGITYVKEVAQNLEAVIRLPGGAYNFGSETEKSMYEITEDFLALIGKDIRLEDGPARHNLWMNCRKAANLGVNFSSVEEGLKACAKDYGLLIG